MKIRLKIKLSPACTELGPVQPQLVCFLHICNNKNKGNLKGRVWERNKCALEDAEICPDYAAIIFLVEKFIF